MGGTAVVVGVAEVSLLVANHLQRLAELQQRSGQASQADHSEETHRIIFQQDSTLEEPGRYQVCGVDRQGATR